MRIIGRIGHPNMQITVFSNDGRFPVQFELSGLTQIYRFRKGDQVNDLGDIRRLIDADFAAAVLRQFREMQKTQSDLFDRHASSKETEDLNDLPDLI